MQEKIQSPQVLACYPSDCQSERIEFLGSAGGFSGAEFWRLTTARGKLCLRRWPAEHPSPERLGFIHAVLRHVAQQGIDYLPVPIVPEKREPMGFVQFDGHLWELTPWLPGRADYHQSPNPKKLRSILKALARFHQAASSFPMELPGKGPSSGAIRRRDRLRRLMAGHIEHIAEALARGGLPEIQQRARTVLEKFPRAADEVIALLDRVVEFEVPLQPCIRDIWHDHVLITGAQVTGIIDFGAMRVETVATDLARLLGSLVGDDQGQWQLGLAAYQSIRELSDEEMALVWALDKSTVLLGGLNWIEWIYCDGRRFENMQGVLHRLDSILARLQHLAP